MHAKNKLRFAFVFSVVSVTFALVINAYASSTQAPTAPAQVSTSKPETTQELNESYPGINVENNTSEPSDNNILSLRLNSLIEQKLGVIKSRLYKEDKKWILRSISNSEIDLDQKEVCYKISFKYVDNWLSYRANAYIYFDITLLGNDYSQSEIRFKRLDNMYMLNPSVEMNKIASEFEEKTNKALVGL
jgi:hypothetical protein